MHRASALCLAAVCFLSAGSANADPISLPPVSYTFSASPELLGAPGRYTVLALYATSGKTSGSSGTISTHLLALSQATSSAKQSVSVPVDLAITNSAGHTTGDKLIGTITGTVWNNGSNLLFNWNPHMPTLSVDNHTYTLSSPSLTQVSGFGLTLGQLSFTMKDPPMTLPGSPLGGGNTSSVHGANTPEPSSCLLAGIGVPLVGLILRRKKR